MWAADRHLVFFIRPDNVLRAVFEIDIRDIGQSGFQVFDLVLVLLLDRAQLVFEIADDQADNEQLGNPHIGVVIQQDPSRSPST